MFAAREYESTAPARGDHETAVLVAYAALTALGFRVHQESAGTLRAEGPRLPYLPRPGLLGVSTLRLRIGGREVSAAAALGPTARVRVLAFLPLLAGGIVLAITRASGGDAPWQAVLGLVPLGLVAFGVATMLARRTRRAVDTFVQNVATAGRRR